MFFPKFSGGDGGKWRDIAHLTLGGYSPYYFFMVLVTIPLLLLLLLLSLLIEDWPAWIVFRPNAHSIPLISFTLALTIILMVACLILLHIPL